MKGKAERSGEDRAFDDGVGQRIRAARHAAGINQTALAKHAGVTFQQIQKYENGSNRVSASRMALIARCLGVTSGHLMGEGEAAAEADMDDAAEVSRLVANYRKCRPEGQKAIRELATTLATVAHGSGLKAA